MCNDYMRLAAQLAREQVELTQAPKLSLRLELAQLQPGDYSDDDLEFFKDCGIKIVEEK